MMHVSEYFQYANTDGIRMIQMYYKDPRYSLLGILPDDPKGMRDMEQNLSAVRILTWLNESIYVPVDVRFPKFDLKTDYELVPILRDLGVSGAFDGNANFSKITHKPLKISVVDHIASVKVTEEGTRAYAVTVGMTTVSGGHGFNSYTFHADRPFIFIIWDNETQSIFFMGKMADPTGISLPGTVFNE